MADWDFIIAPTTVDVSFEINEVVINRFSLRILSTTGFFSGLGEWVTSTAEELSEAQLRTNAAVMEIVSECTGIPDKELTFPGFIDQMRRRDPVEMRDHFVQGEFEGRPLEPTADEFVAGMRVLYAEKIEQGHDFDEAYHRYLYHLLTHPSTMKETVIDHLQFMWDEYLKPEWKRSLPVLEDAVEAFRQMNYQNMNSYEVIETVTGRSMRGNEKFESVIGSTQKLRFVPSTHIGPYLGWIPDEDNKELIIIFGARPPKNASEPSSALSRNELLVRVNALADETRLKILELLTRHDELCAQDFINTLELSQSSASRHLRQLTASGYISERRRDVAKCYYLNPERIEDTINALRDFLQKTS